MTENIDPHHCHCFSLHKNYFQNFKKKMESISFNDTILQEDHGQVYGLVKRLDEYTQIHVKVLKNGTIEAEMEYPPSYPFAHLNQEHSYSAHDEIHTILNYLRMTYTYRIVPPTTCIMRRIKKAVNPTHAKVIVGGLLLAVVIGGLVYYLTKDKEE